MTAKLYGFDFSHPVQAALAMLRHKGIEHQFVDILPGLHPLVVRARGFPEGTVPALVLDGGEKVQGSTAISRRLDELVARAPLFPAEPEARRAVEAAEAWGDSELQPVPRLAYRWALARRRDLRVGMARIAGVPLAGVAGTLGLPQAALIARVSGATHERVREVVGRLPALLDHADRLVDDGTVGGEAVNAADFQIGATIRALLAFDDFRPHLDGRRCRVLADRLPPQRARVPAFLPAGWLPPPG